MNKIGVDIDPLVCPECGEPKYRYAKTCRQCYNIQGKNNPNYKHGKSDVFHSQAPFIWTVLERGGACENCGCTIRATLEIHHKDANPRNNDPDNLELLCANCHKQEHLGATRQQLWIRIDAIRAAVDAEPATIILDEWMESYYPNQPRSRRVTVQCPGCGGTRTTFKNGIVKNGTSFCRHCSQIRRSYSGLAQRKSEEGGKTHGDE